MDSTVLRLLAHLSTFGVITALCLTLFAARGHVIYVARWRLLFRALIVYAAWFLLLAVSIRDVALIPRAQLVWVLASLELTGSVLAWWWYWSMVKASFRIVRQGPYANTSRA